MIQQRHKLLLAIVVTACAIPASSFAQGATRPPDAPADNLTPQDRDALAVAEQLAGDVSVLLDRWITTQAIGEDRLFSRMYYPVAATNPQKWTTPYDTLADRDLPATEDKALLHSQLFLYAVLMDTNAYIPAHNTRVSQPMTGNLGQDYTNSRTKRILGDLASFAAAQSEAHYLLQHVRLENGDTVYDLSVPVYVRGRHWGCVRIAYHHTD